MSAKGYLTLVLHAHLPFIRHPEHPDFLEEDWLYEAITETYIPLLRMMDRMWQDAVDFRLTMSLTPPLCEMLADPLLQERYAARLSKLCELAGSQVEERRGTPFASVAQLYAEELSTTRRLYEEVWGRQLLPVFRSFQDRDRLEIITCGATHGFLPLMATDEARHAQVEVAVRNYEKHFGRRPRGIWLPECAYAPGLDRFLADEGLRYFFVETHGITHASPKPRYKNYRPIFTPSGVAAFGRDVETSRQVWSAESGYPGDPLYREFYRDLGYDLPYEQVAPYLHSDGVRRNLGLKFHRITGKVSLDKKEPYVPEWAAEQADKHAGNFLFNRVHQLAFLNESLGVMPHVTAQYDAELFGHWWFEGPRFLELFFRKAHGDQSEIRFVNPSEYLALEPVQQVATPCMSSWGANGYYDVWLNDKNDWTYRHLHLAEERMVELCTRFPDATGDLRRALNQAARELLLAQSSDWAFIMTMGTTVPYAERRTREHVGNFLGLYDQINENRLYIPWLEEIERRDTIFQEIDYMAWHPARTPTRGAGSAVSAPPPT
jgi:1,4-alpha-glucan branching enzyme